MQADTKPTTREDLLHLASLFTGGTKRDDETTWRRSYHEKVVHAYTGSPIDARRLLTRAAERAESVVEARITTDVHGSPDGLFLTMRLDAIRGFEMMVKGPPREMAPGAFGRGE